MYSVDRLATGALDDEALAMDLGRKISPPAALAVFIDEHERGLADTDLIGNSDPRGNAYPTLIGAGSGIEAGGSGVDRRALVCPGTCVLELGCDPKQHVLSVGSRDELDADR